MRFAEMLSMYAYKPVNVESETYELRRARLKRMMAVYEGSRGKPPLNEATEPEPPATPYRGEVKWLVSPVVDLLFVCGLAPWILGLIAFLLLGANPGARTVSQGPHQYVFNTIFVVHS
jgi:hypothetical protein